MPETKEMELVHLGLRLPKWLKDKAEEEVTRRKRINNLQPYNISSLVRDALFEYLNKEE